LSNKWQLLAGFTVQRQKKASTEEASSDQATSDNFTDPNNDINRKQQLSEFRRHVYFQSGQQL